MFVNGHGESSIIFGIYLYRLNYQDLR